MNNTEQAKELLDGYGCECHGCMKYGEECHGLTSAADKFLTAETAAIRAELKVANKMIAMADECLGDAIAERDEALRVLRALQDAATGYQEVNKMPWSYLMDDALAAASSVLGEGE